MIDALVSFLAGVQPYHWLALGLVLLIAEMFTGTMHLLWPAVAAFAVGLIALILPTDWVAELSLFAVLEIALVLFGAPLVRKLKTPAAGPPLNDRAASLIGARGVAADAFANGAGTVKIHDTLWRAVSDDAIGAGAAVDVVAVDGSTLRVKPA